MSERNWISISGQMAVMWLHPHLCTVPGINTIGRTTHRSSIFIPHHVSPG
jgi:hypothetical protein